MKIKIIYILSLFCLVITGCRKKEYDITPMNDAKHAYVQWFNGTLNSSRNFIYMNGTQINGSTVAFGSLFPASSYAFTVYTGSLGVTIKDTLSSSTQVAQNFVQTFNTDKSYTIFTYDTITSPKKLVVENTDIVYPSDNKARVRFVNLIYNPTTPPNVDIFSVNQNAYLLQNIPVAQLSNFFQFTPYTADTWQVRQVGTGTVMATLTLSSTSLMPKRYYTAVYRGSHRAAANRAFVLIANN